eukprot:scaffold313960_cov30-Tisochrysis_lutea.AAC.2
MQRSCVGVDQQVLPAGDGWHPSAAARRQRGRLARACDGRAPAELRASLAAPTSCGLEALAAFAGCGAQ